MDYACGNDTAAVSKLLSGASDAGQLLQCMEDIKGPWAMIYFHALSNTLWYGRDRVGRRSLVEYRGADSLVLSSVCVTTHPQLTASQWVSVQPRGLYFVRLAGDKDHGPFTTGLLPWTSGRMVPRSLASVRTGNESTTPTAHEMRRAATCFYRVLSESVRRRVAHVASPHSAHTAGSQSTASRVGVLFSGGLDSLVCMCGVVFAGAPVFCHVSLHSDANADVVFQSRCLSNSDYFHFFHDVGPCSLGLHSSPRWP